MYGNWTGIYKLLNCSFCVFKTWKVSIPFILCFAFIESGILCFWDHLISNWRIFLSICLRKRMITVSLSLNSNLISNQTINNCTFSLTSISKDISNISPGMVPLLKQVVNPLNVFVFKLSLHNTYYGILIN